jgi:hypothetical protein
MKTRLFPIALTLSLFLGCAHSRNTDLDAKLSAEKGISDVHELRSEVSQLIENDPALSAEQKARLKDLHAAHVEKINALEKQSLELKSLLVKDLLAQGYNPGEIKDIKSRLRKVEDSRTSALFDAVEKANAILGRSSAQRPRMLRAFLGTGSAAYRE